MGVPVSADPGVGLNPESAPAVAPGITEDEIALYDRQIRLWGMHAQEQIRSAHVLLITARALGNEIAKNLVLAGIGALTLIDHAAIAEADLGAQFLLGVSEDATAILGANRAAVASRQLQAMNPRVRITVDPSDIRSKVPSFFAGFSLVIATDLDPDTLQIINTATRLVSRPFYAANTYGLFGYIFCDLIEHDFSVVRDRGNVATKSGTFESRTRYIVDVQTREEEGGRDVEAEGEGEADTEADTDAAAEPKADDEANKAPPKKARRKPPPPPPPPSKEAVTKRELYSTWLLASDVAGLPADYTRSARRLRRVSPALPCLRALWEFQQLHHRLPNDRSLADIQALTELVTRKQTALGIPAVTAEYIRQFLQSVSAAEGSSNGSNGNGNATNDGSANGNTTNTVPTFASEISPVATILGGQVAQDVINVLGHTQQPLQNMLVFDGVACQAAVYALHPDGPLGRQLLVSRSTEAAAAVAAAAAAGSVGAAPVVAAAAPATAHPVPLALLPQQLLAGPTVPIFQATGAAAASDPKGEVDSR